MNDTLEQLLSRKEDFSLVVTLAEDDIEIPNIPCKIYLPERTHEEPFFLLRPDTETYEKIWTKPCWGLKASRYDTGNNLIGAIDVRELWPQSGRSQSYNRDLRDQYIVCVTEHLQNISYFRHRVPELENTTICRFWISDNNFLSPCVGRSSNGDGKIEYKRSSNIEFILVNNIKLFFDYHYKVKDENEELRQWSYLIASTNLPIAAHNTHKIISETLPDVDDFLLIASLGSRKNTACLGWHAFDAKGSVEYYRGNMVFPERTEHVGHDKGLVYQNNFKEFLDSCYRGFQLYENKKALRSAVYSAVPLSNQNHLETSFLRYFAGLETLILDFRRNSGFEFVLEDKAKWKMLKQYLEDCIRSSTEPKLSKNERCSFYNKLEELNRVSLKEAFEAFCGKYNLDLSDLWPVFSSDKTIGLADIRNRLIHGDPFPRHLFSAMVVASECLTFILERMLVTVLGWDVKNTTASRGFVERHTAIIRILTDEQAKMNAHIKQ